MADSAPDLKIRVVGVTESEYDLVAKELRVFVGEVKDVAYTSDMRAFPWGEIMEPA